MNAEEKWQKAREILNNQPSQSQTEEAKQLLLDAIGENCAGAYTTLGLMHLWGEGYEKDEKKAFELFSRSLELGYERAKYHLSQYYLEGVVVEKDVAKAERYLRDLAEKDDIDACSALAAYLVDGKFPYSSDEEVLALLVKGAEAGNDVAMIILPQFYATLCEDDKAEEWFARLAKVVPDAVAEARANLDNVEYEDRRRHLVSRYVGSGQYEKVFALLDRDKEQRHDVDTDFLIASVCVDGLGPECLGKDVAKALQIYEKYADGGNVYALYNIGLIYERGGTEQDARKAFEYFSKAADLGNSAAQFKVGYYYLHGVSGEVDKQTARHWYELAAEQEFPDALYILACSYLDDSDIDTMSFENVLCEKDAEKGMKLLNRAVELGHPRAMYTLALCYQKGKYVEQSNEKAFETLRLSLSAGMDADNVRVMGDYLRDGIGTEQNYELACQHYKWAADRGDFGAVASLAMMYAHGWGVEKDEARAGELVELSNDIFHSRYTGRMTLEQARAYAKEGDPEAMFQLGCRYQNGMRVNPDMEIASDWWFRAASKGHVQACHELGNFYFFTKHDFANGLKWLKKAAEKNFPLSFAALGDIYLNGWSVDKDVDKGIEFLTRAGEQNVGRALWVLSALYHDDEIVPRDIDKAKYWLERYVALDGAHAHFVMGANLYLGDMYEVDKPKALEHITAAVKGGCHDADQYYITMRWTGDGVEKNQKEVLDTFTELADGGDAKASLMLYYLYSETNADEKNRDKALEYVHKAEESDDADVLRNVAQDYINGREGGLDRDYDKALEILRRLPDDDADACHLQAFTLFSQNGLQDNYTWERSEQAFNLMLKAAEGGLPDAMMRVAYAYLEGRGVKRNRECARTWFEELQKIGYEPEKVKECLERYCQKDKPWDNSLCFQYWYDLIMRNQSRITEKYSLDADNGGVSIDALMRCAAQLGEKNAIEAVAFNDSQDSEILNVGKAPQKPAEPEPAPEEEKPDKKESIWSKLGKLFK